MFTDEIRVLISINESVRVCFSKNWNEISGKKNTKNLSSDKHSLMFWGAIQSNCRKLLAECPNKLYDASYLEILKNYEEKMIFWTFFFNNEKSKLLCINRRLSAIFSKKTSGRY